MSKQNFFLQNNRLKGEKNGRDEEGEREGQNASCIEALVVGVVVLNIRAECRLDEVLRIAVNLFDDSAAVASNPIDFVVFACGIEIIRKFGTNSVLSISNPIRVLRRTYSALEEVHVILTSFGRTRATHLRITVLSAVLHEERFVVGAAAV